MSTPPDAIERAARIQYEAYHDGVADLEPSWDELPESHRHRMVRSLRAALDAMNYGWADISEAPTKLLVLTRHTDDLEPVVAYQNDYGNWYRETNTPLWRKPTHWRLRTEPPA